ncbi:phosphonate C-P lyase system protein PhnH [Cohnella abietis]|uniref:Phosphonate C-P lyase system protein PhnH n=1 Tax=Cohnella abietis TaxID=2507935 RepID=A0A3T1DCQ0_9BACL|nr:phosphonate C-P lyase system protein PhnH [Cohnella abietis]BBI35931.1 phosphonate C-P lyase system protein PhnH [Cohnella abietis]
MEAIVEKVHYTQETFRKLMDAMARPGKIVEIQPFSYHQRAFALRYMLGIGATLLDQEVSFHLCGTEGALAKDIQLLTHSKTKPLEQSDYVLVTGGVVFDVAGCKRGNFHYPDENATIIYQVNAIGEQSLGGGIANGLNSVRLILTGPGVKGESRVFLDGFPPALVDQWQESNQQFPLGTDWIFVDLIGNVCCIPRSTKLQWEVL